MSIWKIAYNWSIILIICLSSAGCKSAIAGQGLPANAEIAFISWNEMNIDLYKIASSGSRNLTNTSHHESYPVWSPDGNQIAFLSNQTGGKHLEVMNADGSNRRLLVKTILARDEPPAWAFDSQMIAFACTYEQRSTICLASVTGNWMQPMPGDWTSIGSIQWAPADPVVLFHAFSGTSKDIFVYITYTGEIRNLTNREGQDFSPTWSSDGRKIAFISTRNAQTGLYTMNIDGTNPHHHLSANINGSLSWSPNGNQIAFSRATGQNHLCVFNLAENTLHCTDKDGSHPTWSPDGQFLVYESRRRNKSYLFLTDARCSQPQRITNNPAGSFTPAWRP